MLGNSSSLGSDRIVCLLGWMVSARQRAGARDAGTTKRLAWMPCAWDAGCCVRDALYRDAVYVDAVCGMLPDVGCSLMWDAPCRDAVCRMLHAGMLCAGCCVQDAVYVDAACRKLQAGSTVSQGSSIVGDGPLLPPWELFILGETEEYFVSLTKQHFTGA